MGYIHGEQVQEQNRLMKLNQITNKNFLEYLGDLHNKNICEVGSGLGVLTAIIANTNKDSFVTGVEISKANYEVAVKNTQDCLNIKLLNDDFLNNKFKEGEFDVTFCRYVLEHVSNAQKVVDEMVRITKKGGIIVCQENDLYNGLIYPPVLEEFCPDVLYTMPSVLDSIVRNSSDVKKYGIRKIVLVGEVASRNWIIKTAKMFEISDKEIYDTYGSIEIGTLAYYSQEYGKYIMAEGLLRETIIHFIIVVCVAEL